jgi:excisionase family DNA binding protein
MDTFDSLVRQIVREEFTTLVREEVRRALDDGAPVILSLAKVVSETNRLYSIRSAAEQLGVSHSYVYSKINAGEIAVVELGDGNQKQRIAATELQRFIEARTYSG